jgi:hypothetical protein
MIIHSEYPGFKTRHWINETATREIEHKSAEQKYVRALYSGGTLCDETQLILKTEIDNIFSNTPLKGIEVLAESLQSRMNTVIDLGDDEFTMGRPHPMIDFSLRNSRLEAEAADPETAVILFDLVLGYGANQDPLGEFLPSLAAVRQKRTEISLICSVTGTEKDPQNRLEVIEAFKDLGVLVCNSNAEAAFLTLEIIKRLGGR